MPDTSSMRVSVWLHRENIVLQSAQDRNVNLKSSWIDLFSSGKSLHVIAKSNTISLFIFRTGCQKVMTLKQIQPPNRAIFYNYLLAINLPHWEIKTHNSNKYINLNVVCIVFISVTYGVCIYKVYLLLSEPNFEYILWKILRQTYKCQSIYCSKQFWRLSARK